MLGFVIGALFVLALPRREPAPPPAPAPEAAPAPPPAPRPMSTIEDVFAQWGKYASWEGDTTEVALWDPATKDYSDCYEVLRSGEAIFFRSIPRLTRPVLRHGMPDGDSSPLLFTETAAQRDAWLKAARDENWRAFGDALHGTRPAGDKAKAAQ